MPGAVREGGNATRRGGDLALPSFLRTNSDPNLKTVRDPDRFGGGGG